MPGDTYCRECGRSIDINEPSYACHGCGEDCCSTCIEGHIDACTSPDNPFARHEEDDYAD